jgi:hypothetical protein
MPEQEGHVDAAVPAAWQIGVEGWQGRVPMTATPQEKVTVPVSRDILAEVDDVVHLGPQGTVDYVLKDFVLQVHARRAGLARARELAAEGSLDVEFLQDQSRYRASGL